MDIYIKIAMYIYKLYMYVSDITPGCPYTQEPKSMKEPNGYIKNGITPPTLYKMEFLTWFENLFLPSVDSVREEYDPWQSKTGIYQKIITYRAQESIQFIHIWSGLRQCLYSVKTLETSEYNFQSFNVKQTYFIYVASLCRY